MINTIIIGAGISGLFVLKHLKENSNHDVLVIDKNPEPFGVWNIKNHPSVKNFTYCVSSKLYMTISDFPIPKEYPEFPHHDDILQYYKSYATKFDLFKHLLCNITVIKIKKKQNIWHIKTNDKVYKCKYLVLACGIVNNCLNIPKDEMYNNFTGIKFHADNFDEHKSELINKKILLVGVSDTSCDIAEDLKTNNIVTMSSNKGVWLQNRNLGAHGPADMFYSRFVDFFIKNIIGKKLFQYIFFGRLPLTVPLWWGENGHGIKEWATDSDYLNSYYVKSRDIISSISKGQIKAVGGVKEINKNEITFTNTKDNFDVIIFCTGYKPFGSLNFIDKIYYQHIYKHIFSYEDNSLYFVGYIRPYLTSIPMISELQSRWISKEICNNNTTLPNKNEMLIEIKKDKIKQKNEFPTHIKRLDTMIDPYDYCNMIADKINTKPNMCMYLATNINLFIIILFYSWNHHYFRLNDSNTEKAKIAYDNIFETCKNDTSIMISNLSFWYPLNCITIILILLILFRRFTKE